MSAVPDLRHHPELDGKTFLLGVGAMKCATSWVFQYLSSLEGLTPSVFKELHFFNTRVPVPGHEPFTGLITGVVHDALNRAPDIAEELRINPELQAGLDCLRMVYDDNAYFDYFARLTGPETKVLSEITPQYQVLGRDGFAYVRDVFASQRMHLKVLFVLRDPVARLWSHLRHLAARDQSLDIVANWQQMIRPRGVIERSDYWGTIEALELVFPPDDVLCLFYEDLFSGDALQQLCDFIDLPFSAPDTARQNETAVTTALPDDIRAKLARVLAPQYDFCRKRFGAAIPAAWQG